MLADIWKDESGVSEAIGFILVFMIVILGISIVTLYGYPVLADARISSDEKIMEQNMIVLQSDIKILTRNNVPYRDTTMGVSGGSIFVTNSTEAENKGGGYFNITFFNKSTGGPESRIYYPGSLEFVSDEGTAVISVTNGAVVKRQLDQNGSVMVSDPRWFYDETNGKKTLVIFMTTLKSTRQMTLGGIETIQMRMLDAPHVEDQDYTKGGGIAQNVKIEYYYGLNDKYSRAWENYLTGPYIVQNGFLRASFENSDIYWLSVDRLIIKEYIIEIL
ncbi:MAG: hypothetical protein GX097_04875 [Methanomicrobiales archaeon]|nr:hypothetical protein [Methanomicrobiales archaeon]